MESFEGLGTRVTRPSGITLNLTGGWNGDYIVTFTHVTPANVVEGSVVLEDRMGVDGSHPAGFANAGFNNTVIAVGNADITTAGSYSSTTTLGNGPYAPQGGVSFASFAGITALETWLLYITDNSGGDVGTLVNWSMSLDVISAVSEPTTWAGIIFFGLFGGTQLVREIQKRKAEGGKAES